MVEPNEVDQKYVGSSDFMSNRNGWSPRYSDLKCIYFSFLRVFPYNPRQVTLRVPLLTAPFDQVQLGLRKFMCCRSDSKKRGHSWIENYHGLSTMIGPAPLILGQMEFASDLVFTAKLKYYLCWVNRSDDEVVLVTRKNYLRPPRPLSYPTEVPNNLGSISNSDWVRIRTQVVIA